MTQRNLWDAPPPPAANTNGLARRNAPATSKDAARSMSSSSGTIRVQVLEYIDRLGPSGATCDEVELALDLRHQTAAARLRELETGGHVWTSGQRATRSGRMAQVYLVTSQGRAALRAGG